MQTKVDRGIGRTRLGQRIFECVFSIGTRSAQRIMASGFTAAQTGRTHDRTQPMLQELRKFLPSGSEAHVLFWAGGAMKRSSLRYTAAPSLARRLHPSAGPRRAITISAMMLSSAVAAYLAPAPCAGAFCFSVLPLYSAACGKTKNVPRCSG